jgi:hypothetical protein
MENDVSYFQTTLLESPQQFFLLLSAKSLNFKIVKSSHEKSRRN